VTEFETRTERVADSTYIVSVTGEIDLATGPALSTALHAALDAGATQLIVDLSNCRFMDSTGISILVGANQRLNHSGNPVAVVTGHSSVHPVLQITAVDAMLRLYPTRSAALNGNARD
jgi:anti-anti-sigma factor